jgi:hypothetical protein
VIEALASLQALGNRARQLHIQLKIAVIAPRLNVVLPKTGLLHMVLLALAHHALSAYFGVAICSTECGRKPQNQNSISLLAPIDKGEFIICPQS